MLHLISSDRPDPSMQWTPTPSSVRPGQFSQRHLKPDIARPQIQHLRIVCTKIADVVDEVLGFDWFPFFNAPWINLNQVHRVKGVDGGLWTWRTAFGCSKLEKHFKSRIHGIWLLQILRGQNSTELNSWETWGQPKAFRLCSCLARGRLQCFAIVSCVPHGIPTCSQANNNAIAAVAAAVQTSQIPQPADWRVLTTVQCSFAVATFS